MTAMPDLHQLLFMLATQSHEHAVIFIAPDGTVQWWSPGAERIFQYTSAEILGKPSQFMFTEQDAGRGIPEFELEAAAKDNSAEDDRWQRRKDGSRFWASGLMCALRDAQGELVGYGKVLRNRTDQRELTETLRNRITALEEFDRRQEVFLSTLAHELSNPLQPLANAARIIRAAGTPSEDVDFALRVIERQVQLLRTLVTDLFEFSRAGAKKIQLKIARVALRPIIDNAVGDVRELAEQRRHVVQVIAPREPIEVNGDAERLHQVLVNLLTNACKYTPAGGRISVKMATEGEEAVIRVEDTGVGIPRDMLPRIFEMFTQVPEARALSMGGLGIGLALVKELVTLHGGSVQVLSEGVGKGAEFTIRVPAIVDDPDEP